MTWQSFVAPSLHSVAPSRSAWYGNVWKNTHETNEKKKMKQVDILQLNIIEY